MNAVEVLTKARAILAERGVLRDGHYAHDETGPCCSYGAVIFATGGCVSERGFIQSSEDDDAYELELEATRILICTLRNEHHTELVAQWNDRTTTDDEVLEMFDKAIIRAQQLTETE